MNNIQTVTVYLGSSGWAAPVFKESAKALGGHIAKHGKHLVYGGMDAGLMGILARTTLEKGGKVTGIIPKKIKDSERILPGLSETVLVEELCDRKKKMFLAADAVIALPGGFGTLDESLEILYWGAKQLHKKPLLLVNIEGYWDSIIAYLPTLPDFDPRFLIVAQSVEEVFPALEKWHAPDFPLKSHDHYPHFEDEITRGTNEPIIIDRASVENTYMAVCALGLKQLGKHKRPLGFVNTDGQFDRLHEWFLRAAKETFITQKCLKLYDISEEEDVLHRMLEQQENVHIDLHREKWGAAD